MHLSLTWSFWYWFILAGILLTAEILVPGAFFLWIGIAAALTGAAAWFFPAAGIAVQLVLFAVFSLLSVLVWRKLYRNPEVCNQPTADHRGAQYIGQVFTLREPIVGGVGRLVIDDTSWRILGADCKAGGRVKVTGVSGVALTVEPAD